MGLGKPEVVVLSADHLECQKLCALVSHFGYRAVPMRSLADLAGRLMDTPHEVLLLDLDTIPADNQIFRTLKRGTQGLQILTISRKSYHPGLEEAMGSHIYACLVKPLNPDELLYWLKSIEELMARTAAEGVEPSPSRRENG